MLTVCVEDFALNLPQYLQKVKEGEHIILIEDNKPIANLRPRRTIAKPGWKRKINKIKVKGDLSPMQLLKCAENPGGKWF